MINEIGNRILIIGCGGSGKTTFAKHLQQLIKIPIIHMDNYYWDENWQRKSDVEWNTIVKKLCQQPQWIMDGNYTKMMPLRFRYATTVIYLDMARWKCILRVIIRRFRFFYNKKRTDIPSNCKERINVEFYRWVWNYPKRSRLDIVRILDQFEGNVYYLRSNSEIKKFLASITTSVMT